jgi:hypothetical protein
MQFFHRTYAAPAILSEGFRDATGTYLTDREWTGVWVSDRPLDMNEGANGNTLLVLEIPEAIVTPYEWVYEGGNPYREFLVPASLLNAYGPPAVYDESEEAPLPLPDLLEG